MRQLLYPERRRCRACRQYFGFQVIWGLYCGRECAGLPPWRPPADAPYLPGEQILELPRCCRTVYRKGTARPKIRYRSEQDAREAISLMNCTGTVDAYECPHCGYWHTGSWHVPAIPNKP